jgi:hypothetical protein
MTIPMVTIGRADVGSPYRGKSWRDASNHDAFRHLISTCAQPVFACRQPESACPKAKTAYAKPEFTFAHLKSACGNPK